MVSLVKGYDPDFDSRFAPFLLGGWFYITRSGYWLKKFKYKKGDDRIRTRFKRFSENA